MKRILSLFVCTLLILRFSLAFASQTIDELQKRADAGDPEAMGILASYYHDGEEGLPKNPQKALSLFERAANLGNVKAIIILGYAYAVGEVVPQDVHKAHEYWMKAINHSEWNSLNAEIRGKVYYTLGLFYGEGQGVSQDKRKAKEYYRKACDHGFQDGCNEYHDFTFTNTDDLQRLADAGDQEAMVLLASYYQDGKKDIPKNPQKAFSLWERAANLGNVKAILMLGDAYAVGEVVHQDVHKAHEYWMKAINHPEWNREDAELRGAVYFALGELYAEGQGVSQDKRKAREYYGKACGHGYQDGCKEYRLAKVNAGDPEAILELAYCYEKGNEGLPKDQHKALLLFERAANLGNVKAIMKLGYAYHFGQGVPQDAYKAHEYWLKAINHPEWNTIPAKDRGEIYFNLGIDYVESKGVTQDYYKAMEYYSKAADLGDAKAMFNIGVVYFKGQGAPQDYHKAKEYFGKACNNRNQDGCNALNFANHHDELQSRVSDDDPVAMLELGNEYLLGMHALRDPQKAILLYERAANLGYIKAIRKLSDVYYFGNDIPKDYHKAVEYSRKAADLGDTESILRLGLCYYKGEGVRRDYRKAKEYYGKACNHGDQIGCARYSEMEKDGLGY